MITQLDTQSWAKELQTGNAQFVAVTSVSPPAETIYVVSNVRADGTFVVLRSDLVPPAAGPGASFTVVAIGNLNPVISPPVPPLQTIDFDPVVAYDSSTGLLHIIGTMDDPSSNP